MRNPARAAVLLAIVSALVSAANFDELDREAAAVPDHSDPAAAARRMSEDVREASSAMDAQYARMLETMERQQRELERKVLRQWTEVHRSTTKEWVDYSDRGDAVSRVDFEKGKVVVEVLVPADADAKTAERLAREKVKAQTERVLRQKDADLKEQLAPQALEAPKIVLESKPVVAQDGTPRRKARVELELLPDHLKVRVKKHEKTVLAAARQYGLDPALVFAVIHTESYFNPRARSPAPAFGLMQLMAQTGAREAYKFAHGKDKLLTPEELYDPELNVRLGAAYLHVLQTRHFGKIKDEEKRRLVSIAAYNCGPGCARKHLVSKSGFDGLSAAELRALIGRSVPKETQAYVPKVESRMALYRSL